MDKPGEQVDPASAVRIKKVSPKYVSRAGLKLEAALRELQVEVEGRICLDLGASTGGFTDCLLRHGARKVYAFDVGRGQLHWKLQRDPRVILQDNVNVRYLDTSMVEDSVDLAAVDLSFISLRLVLPLLKPFFAQVLALVKPQFEARREEVEPGGLITSPGKQKEIVQRVKTFALSEGFSVEGKVASPVTGQKGNQEYFLLLQ